MYFFVHLKVNTRDMALPGNLSYFLSRMQGVSTNYFKIFPNNTGTSTPSKILRFELPSNSLLNLRSLQLMFAASTTGATAGGRLPNKIDSLIERYALYAGGVLVSHGYNQYNVLRHAKDVLQGNKCSSVTGHATQGGLVRIAGYKESGAFTSTASIANTTAAGAVTQDVLVSLAYSLSNSRILTPCLYAMRT